MISENSTCQEGTCYCHKFIEECRRTSVIGGAISALSSYIADDLSSAGKTIQGLMKELDPACEHLYQVAQKSGLLQGKTILTLKAVCAIYKRMVRQVSMSDEDQNIDRIRERIQERSQILAQHYQSSKNRIAQNAKALLRDGMTILMHGYSSVVLHVLIKAVQRGVRLNVIVTECNVNDKGGNEVKKILEDNNITTKLISDAAVGVVMPKVDCIFVGCEAVLENGGIVNKIGTFTVALCAQTFQKPFYVFTESLKFMKEFPLKQDDALKLVEPVIDFEKLQVDYTPPEYLTLLFTSIGIFTPSAVSDELIEFFSS